VAPLVYLSGSTTLIASRLLLNMNGVYLLDGRCCYLSSDVSLPTAQNLTTPSSPRHHSQARDAAAATQAANERHRWRRRLLLPLRKDNTTYAHPSFSGTVIGLLIPLASASAPALNLCRGCINIKRTRCAKLRRGTGDGFAVLRTLGVACAWTAARTGRKQRVVRHFT